MFFFCKNVDILYKTEWIIILIIKSCILKPFSLEKVNDHVTEHSLVNYLIQGFLQPGSYNQGSYNLEFVHAGVLTSRGLTTRGSYIQGFLQPGVLQHGILTSKGRRTRVSYI